MTAQDVLFSFQVALDPTVHPSVQDLLKMGGKFYEVSAPDDYTVVIKTPSPNAVALATIGVVRIMPKHVLEAPFKAGSFAAAYNVEHAAGPVGVEWPMAGRAIRPRREDGARAAILTGTEIDQQKRRLPYLDEVIFLSVPDQDAADLKFRAGELDGLERVKPENYRWYTENQQKGNFTLYDIGPDLNTNFLWFNLNTVKKAGGREEGRATPPSMR